MPDASPGPAAPKSAERGPLRYEEMKLDRLDAVMGQARALRSTYMAQQLRRLWHRPSFPPPSS